MKVGNKLALAVAVLAASSGTYAMDAMTDDALSDATGQAGLTITTNLPAAGLTGTFVYTDTNGSTGTAAATSNFATANTFSGDVLASFKLTGDPLTMTIDAGATTSGAANLLIDLKTGATSGLAIGMTSDLYACATSNDANGACAAANKYDMVTFVGNPNISLINMDAQILLGAPSASQHMIQAVFSSGFNLTIGSNTAAGSAVAFGILDGNNFTSAATEGGIGMSELAVSLPVNAQVNIDACNGTNTGGSCTASNKGLLIGFAGTAGTNVNMYNVTLGNIGTTAASAAIGNVALYGLNLNGTTVQIAGH